MKVDIFVLHSTFLKWFTYNIFELIPGIDVQ